MKVERKTGKANKRKRKVKIAPLISEHELAALGDGRIAYVREMTSEQAITMFPAIKDLPNGLNLFALHAADGTPIMLTDTRQAAVGQAIEEELEVRSVH